MFSYFFFFSWAIFWILLLLLPPGPKEIVSCYRLNFFHGLISSIVSILCVLEVLSFPLTTNCTLSYFVVDFINILLTDFIWKVPSYHNPQSRKVEYFHHILCFIVGLMSELYYQDYCSFEKNPFVKLMFAEIPTPFLIAWRYYKYEWIGVIFGVVFFIVRILYQGIFLVPDCIRNCHPIVGYGFGIPYNILNLYFFYGIVRKAIRDNWKKSTSR